jgi:hypothetical protein
MKTRFLVLLVSLACGLVHAQFTIDWHSINGGGGTSTGGVYSITGTVGQPDAGVMSGGAYSLIGGFWGILSTTASAEVPHLTVALTGDDAVVISWPSPSTGFVLQQAANLSAPGWAPISQTPTDNGTIKSIIVKPPLGNVFYRLAK